MRQLERSTIETWLAGILGLLAASVPMTWWFELILLMISAGLVTDIGLHAPGLTKSWHKMGVILGGIGVLAALGGPSALQRYAADNPGAPKPVIDSKSARIIVDGIGLGQWLGKRFQYLNVQITNKGPSFSTVPVNTGTLVFSEKVLTAQQEDSYMAPLVGNLFTSPQPCNKSQMQVGQTVFHTMPWNIQPDVIDKLRRRKGYVYVFHVMSWCDASVGKDQRRVNEYCAALQDLSTTMYCHGHNEIYAIGLLPSAPQ